ncbi:MAG: competence/damage-inducible protein A [Acidimicrobiia bacterium]
MIVEVVGVGTELLLGQIVNGNAAVIGAALAEAGHDAHFQQVVGDNQARLEQAITLAMSRADAVIITGGIGPTQDDLTREALAAATGRSMAFDEGYAERLEKWWASRGRDMPRSNLRQAEYPQGAELLPNPKGTAPGLHLDHGGTRVFCVPGVPEEMEYLLIKEVLPRLSVASGGPSVVMSRMLRTWGRSESDIADLLDDLYRGSTNPSIAFLASAGEIKVRITAKAGGEGEAQALIGPIEEEIRGRFGEAVFGVDDETIERVVIGLLADRGLTIGTAESMTGGLVAAALTSIPGASAVMRGGLVAYDHELKRSLLGVSDIDRVVDPATAEEMAAGGRKLLEADVVVAVTGSAGPDPLEQPPGSVVIAVATPDEIRSKTLHLPGDRERVRAYSVTAALQLTRLALVGRWWSP